MVFYNIWNKIHNGKNKLKIALVIKKNHMHHKIILFWNDMKENLDLEEKYLKKKSEEIKKHCTQNERGYANPNCDW